MIYTRDPSLVLPLQIDLTEEEREKLFEVWTVYTDDLVHPGGEELVEIPTEEEQENEIPGCSCCAEGRICSREPDAEGRSCECIEDYGQFFIPPPPKSPTSSSSSSSRVLSLPHPPHLPLVECGPLCACASRPSSSSCQNRLTQPQPSSSIQPPPTLRLHSSSIASLGISTLVHLPKGSFVCTYDGELISTVEARRRWEKQEEGGGGGNYIFSMKTSNGRVNVDPRTIGGIGRFLNHSHSPNVFPLPVHRTPTHRTVPRIAFFALREVNAGEELVWDYGDGEEEEEEEGKATTRPKRVKCFCDAGEGICSGWMPFDESL
ncbi:hypothetical protein BDY24DRAFT_374738 [Mrakia frigida]|uniref:uncharacterized protein n=1 Tax=Mrakia frigida TaxID=29902 RepID=UPI003FCC167F